MNIWVSGINFACFYYFFYCILGLFRRCGILELFRRCGILGLFRRCGIFILYFGTVPTVWYFYIVFWDCSDGVGFLYFIMRLARK